MAFTGKVFEKYATWLLRESVGRDNRHNQFFSSPKYERDGTEVCDGIVLCGCDAVFIEYKGGVFTAASKYGRNPGNLHAEIEEKLIRNPEGKRKGIEQLAEAIRRTCRKTDFDRIHGIDLSGVRRIFPLLVLRDVTRASTGAKWAIRGLLRCSRYRSLLRERQSRLATDTCCPTRMAGADISTLRRHGPWC